jgi:hypothetical protein
MAYQRRNQFWGLGAVSSIYINPTRPFAEELKSILNSIATTRESLDAGAPLQSGLSALEARVVQYGLTPLGPGPEVIVQWQGEADSYVQQAAAYLAALRTTQTVPSGTSMFSAVSTPSYTPAVPATQPTTQSPVNVVFMQTPTFTVAAPAPIAAPTIPTEGTSTALLVPPTILEAEAGTDGTDNMATTPAEIVAPDPLVSLPAPIELPVVVEEARSQAETLVKAVNLAEQEAIAKATAEGRESDIPALQQQYAAERSQIIADAATTAAEPVTSLEEPKGSKTWLWLLLLGGGVLAYYYWQKDKKKAGKSLA